MILKNWEELPDFMKTSEVKEYYDILSHKKISLICKRLIDIVLSCIMIIISSPLLLFLFIWIKFDSKGPAFYRQERITRYGKKFKIWKFRTMVMNADKVGTLVTLSNDERITRVGHKLRSYRLDELPQLFNVFIGDMSFVGTRPEVAKYVSVYTNEMKASLLLPAGITSMASIEFKDENIILEKYRESLGVDLAYINEILPQKMNFNLLYLKKYSLLRDIKICFKTLSVFDR